MPSKPKPHGHSGKERRIAPAVKRAPHGTHAERSEGDVQGGTVRVPAAKQAPPNRGSREDT